MTLNFTSLENPINVSQTSFFKVCNSFPPRKDTPPSWLNSPVSLQLNKMVDLAVLVLPKGLKTNWALCRSLTRPQALKINAVWLLKEAFWKIKIHI